MKKLFLLFSLFFLVFSCGKKDKFMLESPGEARLNQDYTLKIHNINHTPVDSVVFYIDGKKSAQEKFTSLVKTRINKKNGLGKHQAKLILTREGKEIFSKTFPLEIYAGVEPVVYEYELINTYPHDPEAFTQGLEFHKDTLYEGTGLNGHSSLRKTDYKTGKILKKIQLDKKYFGEGISILNNKVYQLTWKSNKGFVYDLNFNKLKEFPYKKSKEGWGLCNDGKVLYKSDGTEKIWILDPENLEEKSYISVYTNKHKIKKINELEWVKGKIFTNVWTKNALAIIDPETGEVTGIINLAKLTEKLDPGIRHDVLNGIAYKPSNGHLFVTGKFWDKLFEIKIPGEIFKN